MSILRTSATKSTSWSKSSAPANRASEAEGCQRQLRASGAAGAATERRRPEIEHGPTGGARESKQASGLGWLGRGRRGPVCLRSKSLNSLCTQSHAASMSPLMPSPSRRAGISCGRGCERDDGWSKPFSERLFFIPPFPLSLFALRRFQRQVAPCRSVRSRTAPPCSRTPHLNARRTDASADVRPVRPHRAAPAVQYAAVVCARHFSRLTAAGTSLSRGLWRRWIHAGVITATRRRYA